MTDLQQIQLAQALTMFLLIVIYCQLRWGRRK